MTNYASSRNPLPVKRLAYVGATCLFLVGIVLVVMDSLLAALPVLLAGLFMGFIARRRAYVRMTQILSAGLIFFTGFRTRIAGSQRDDPLWFVFLTIALA